MVYNLYIWMIFYILPQLWASMDVFQILPQLCVLVFTTIMSFRFYHNYVHRWMCFRFYHNYVSQILPHLCVLILPHLDVSWILSQLCSSMDVSQILSQLCASMDVSQILPLLCASMDVSQLLSDIYFYMCVHKSVNMKAKCVYYDILFLKMFHIPYKL